MKDKIIETPMLSIATFVKSIGNVDVYYDECEYWTVNENGRIESAGDNISEIEVNKED